MHREDLSKSGAQAATQFLEENRTIKIFSCCENEITSLGAKIIFEALSDSTVIEEIRLDDNEIGDIGGSAIVEAYGPGGEEKMPALRRICLDHNGFSDGCVDQLLEAFGEKLIPMEENDNEADFDDALSVGESEDGVDADEDEDVDELDTRMMLISTPLLPKCKGLLWTMISFEIQVGTTCTS